MGKRLKRLDFVYQHFPLYFVTARTANRQSFLTNERIHPAFKQFGESGAEYGGWIGTYVLMPDHLHLFVAIDNQNRLYLNGSKL
jgi:REP element-mobilizing transposase RayT